MPEYEVLMTHDETYCYRLKADSPEEAAAMAKNNEVVGESIDQGEYRDIEVYEADTMAPNLLAPQVPKTQVRLPTLDYHIADNAETPFVAITRASDGLTLFQLPYSAESTDFALQIVHRCNAWREETEGSTPNGFDPRWVEAINQVLRDRYDDDEDEPTPQIKDISPELWDQAIGPMIDAISEQEPFLKLEFVED